MSECQIFQTPFKEFRGVYEFHKTKALAQHLRAIADVCSRSQSVSICSKAPERPWLQLREWTDETTAQREGDWCSDLEFVGLQ